MKYRRRDSLWILLLVELLYVAASMCRDYVSDGRNWRPKPRRVKTGSSNDRALS